MLIYLECRAKSTSVWPEGTLLRRAAIEEDLLQEFQGHWGHFDPTCEWREVEWTCSAQKNAAIMADFYQEFVKVNRFKLVKIRRKV